MTFYTYGTYAAYNPDTDEVVENAEGGKFRAVKDGPDIPIYDLNQTPIVDNEITTNGNGQTSQFLAEDVLSGLIQFGDVVVTVWANEVAALAAQGPAAAASAAAAATSAAQAAAAAQAAQAAAEAASSGGGGGGLDGAALDTRMGGDTVALIDRMIMPRYRATTGEWEPRPDCRCAITIGTAPAPTDLVSGVDVWIQLP